MFRGVDFDTFPVTVSLHTASPGDSGANEVQNEDGSNYTRQSATFTVAANKTISNAGAVDFLDMPEVDVTHAGLWSGSLFLWGGTLLTPTVVDVSRALRIPPLDLDISIT